GYVVALYRTPLEGGKTWSTIVRIAEDS
ncbi:hypothetical protein KGM_204424B, partial [Danaus plexippus plexippus]